MRVRPRGSECEGRDGYRAVEEVLRVGTYEDDEEIRRDVDRLYEIARESLSVVWSLVRAVAKALLAFEELDRSGFDEALGDADLYVPVFGVQRAHGLLPVRSGEDGRARRIEGGR